MTSVEQRGCPVLSEIRGLAVVLGFEHRVPAAELTCSPLFRLNERPSGKCGPCSRNAPQKGSVVMTRKILMGFFVSLVSVSSGAQAMTLTHGASFVAFNAGQAQNVDYLTSGARTNMSGVQMLISPVTRGLVSISGFQTFTLTGFHVGMQTSNCTLFVMRSNGTALTSADLSPINVAGAWSKSVNVTGNFLQQDAQVSVLCTIPGPFLSVLAGITSSP